MFGAEERRLTVEGTRIAVFLKGDQAQAIRLDHAPRSAQPLMPARLRRAIAMASGCTIRPGSDHGDTGVVTARIDCPGGRAP